MRYTLSAFLSWLLLSSLILGCSAEQEKKKHDPVLHDHTLFLGEDSLKFFPLYNVVACEVLHDLERPNRFSKTGLTMFDPLEHDTLRLDHFVSRYLHPYPDCYDDYGSYILDTTSMDTVEQLPISKFLGKKKPDELFADLQSQLAFTSPTGKYTIASLRFIAYCPDSECQWVWSRATEDFKVDEQLHAELRKYFSKDMYLVLNMVVACDEHEHFVRIHPGLCWLGK